MFQRYEDPTYGNMNEKEKRIENEFQSNAAVKKGMRGNQDVRY